MTLSPAIFDFFRRLPRQAPGRDDIVPRAIRALALPLAPRIADFGCGTGGASLQLARESGGTLLCVDTAGPFLATLDRAAAAAGLADRIETRCADMMTPGVDPASLDLIWAEGSVYIPGFQPALERWRPLLRPGAALVVSDCVWLTPDPPSPARAFWNAAYPDMTDLAARRAQAMELGYRCIDAFQLGMAAWDDYYASIRAALAGHPDLPADFVQGIAAECDTFDRARGSYDYGVLFLRAP